MQATRWGRGLGIGLAAALSGCSSCSKDAANGSDGGLGTVALPDAASAPLAGSAGNTAPSGGPLTCKPDGAPVLLDKLVRGEAGMTFVHLTGDRVGLGYADSDGAPKAYVVKGDGSTESIPVDASGLAEFAVKPPGKTVRTVVRVTPLEEADGKMRVGYDAVDVAPDKTRTVRCGPADKAPLFAFTGRSVYEGAAGGDAGDAAATETRECRTASDPAHEWALATELRPGTGTDVYEARWLAAGGTPIGAVASARTSDGGAAEAGSAEAGGAGDGGASVDHGLEAVVDTRKIDVTKEHAPPKPERHLFDVPEVVPTDAGYLLVARYNGQIVFAKRGADLSPKGAPSNFWLGVATGTPAVAARPGAVALVAATFQKYDLFATTFPPDAKPTKPEPLVLDDPAARTEGDRSSLSATYLPGGELVLVFADGKATSKRVRLAVLDKGMKPVGPVIDVSPDAETAPDVRATTLPDGRVYVAWIAHGSAPGMHLTGAVYKCAP